MIMSRTHAAIWDSVVIRDMLAFAGVAMLMVGLHISIDFPLRSVLLAMVASLSFYRIAHSGISPQLYRAALFLCAAALLFIYGLRFVDYFRGPPENWDFMAFYFDAYVARFGESLFSPGEYHLAAKRLDEEMNALGIVLGDNFRREIIDVGFKNPPFTAFVLYPLTFLPMEASHAAWRSMVVVSILMLAAVMAKNLSDHCRPTGHLRFLDCLAFCLVIVLTMRAATMTMVYGQTSAIVAIFLLMAIAAGEKNSAGIWAALAVIVKPVAGIIFLYFILLRGWSRILTSIGVLLIAAAASAIAFGVDDWIAYLRLDFAERSPAWLYFQDNTTSLLAEVMRWKGVNDHPWKSPGLMEGFYATSLLLLAVSSLLVLRYGRLQPRLAAALLIAVGLTIYPGTQVSYGVITAIPLAIVLIELWERRCGVVAIAGLVCVTIGLLNYMPIFAWAFLAAVAFGLLLSPGSRQASVESY
jgi:hypothetical protein